MTLSILVPLSVLLSWWGCLIGLVVEASALRAEDPGLIPTGVFPLQVIPVTEQFVLQWLACQALSPTGSSLGLIGLVSLYQNCVR